MSRVQVLNETSLADSAQNGATLCFQWYRSLDDDGHMEHGYRFIWKRPSSDIGSQQAARGQARLPSVDVIEQLIWQAKSEGWGDFDGDRIDSSSEENWARGITPKP